MDLSSAKRRRFLRKTIFVLSGLCTYLLGGFSIIPMRHFVFKVKMKYQDDAFDVEQRPWENTTSFATINSKYYLEGKILSLKKNFFPEKNIVEWTYIFNSEDSFLNWDKEVVETNTFQAQLVPGDVEYEFEVQKYG